jgi:hypothetical protein
MLSGASSEACGANRVNGERGAANGAELFLFGLDHYGLEILRFKNLAAIKTFHIIDSVTPRNHDGFFVFAGVLHTEAEIQPILMIQ